MVISTLVGVTCNHKCSYPNIITLVTKSHDPLSGGQGLGSRV